GLAFRAIFDEPASRTIPNYLRSAVYGVGVGWALWGVYTGFASGARSRLGAALRRLPLAGEVVVRAIVTTVVLIVVGIALELLLFPELRNLDVLTGSWLTVMLPRIV